MIEWKCLYDKLIVKRAAPEKEMGVEVKLEVADAYQQEQNQGVVLRVGEGRWVDGVLLPLTIKPGMTVLFSKHAGQQLEGAAPDTIILREDEVLAYLE